MESEHNEINLNEEENNLKNHHTITGICFNSSDDDGQNINSNKLANKLYFTRPIRNIDDFSTWIYDINTEYLIGCGILFYFILRSSLFIVFLINKFTIRYRFQTEVKPLSFHDSQQLRGINEKFYYQTGNDFTTISYFGKDELLDEFTNEWAKMTYLINKKPQAIVKKLFKAENMHSFFLGPPGTGKTQFIKKAIYVFDMKLRLLYSKKNKKISDKDLNLNRLSAKELGKLHKMQPRVKLFSLLPSDLSGNWFGRQEELLKYLFDDLTKIDNTYCANVLLIDEAEYLFPVRTDNISGYENSRSLLAEFLSQFNRLNDLQQPIFIVAITNMYDRIDPAIKRRLFNNIKFNMPTEKERLAIIKEYLKDFISSSTNFEHDPLCQIILKATKTKISHSLLVSVLVESIESHLDTDKRQFNLVLFLNKIQANKIVFDQTQKAEILTIIQKYREDKKRELMIKKYLTKF